jgi:hypothetical protein
MSTPSRTNTQPPGLGDGDDHEHRDERRLHLALRAEQGREDAAARS